MSLEALQVFWFVLLGVLMAGYAILDGFDLGAGMLHLFAREDRDRSTIMAAIGPHWNSNEVWLLTFGGALFAAFPDVYATAFSTFYLAFMLLLFCLIFRGLSLEFRGKEEGAGWRRFWDGAFAVSSTVATLLFGVATGNLVRGFAIDGRKEYTGGFFDLLHPYPVVVGLLALALFALHGSLFLGFKTEGALQERVRAWTWRAWWAFSFLLVVTAAATLALYVRVREQFAAHSWAWVVLAAAVLLTANTGWAFRKGRQVQAFVSSGAVIAALVVLLGAALYPNLLTSTTSSAYSLTVQNASSSRETLRVMQLIAFLGVPLVLAYTIAAYRIFRGKAKPHEAY